MGQGVVDRTAADLTTCFLWPSGPALAGLLIFAALAGCVAPDSVAANDREPPRAPAANPRTPIVLPTNATPDAPSLPLVLPAGYAGVIPALPDRPVFWVGARMQPTGLPTSRGEADPAVCDGQGRGKCPEFVLDVAEGGIRLRVSLDHPGSASDFALQLRTEDGKVLGYDDGTENEEILLDTPAAGRYVVRVLPWQVSQPADPPFALRVKLETTVAVPPDGVLLPNLRVEPPSEFTFLQPPPFYRYLVPMQVREKVSCLPDEMAEEGARRCLRFSFGYQNVGAGPMDLHFSPLTDAAATASVVQRMHRADGRFEEQPAGSYTYHKTHMHYHYDDIFSAKLFRVTDAATGAMEPAGIVAKRGACAHDIRISDWERFDQAPRGSQDSGDDCSSFYAESPASGMRIGLSAGWSDIYPWLMPSNYVEFGGQPDGRYVIRAIADPNGRLAETDESDNVGYSYVEIHGETIELLERGRGQDPWDPARIVEQWPRNPVVAAP